MEFNTNDTKYRRVLDRVAKLKRFYGQALRGLLAILITGAINYYLNEWSHPWFLWVVFGVVVLTILRAIRLFGAAILFGKDWEEQKVRQFMEKDNF